MLYFLCKVNEKSPKSGKNVFDFIEISLYNDRKRTVLDLFLRPGG